MPFMRQPRIHTIALSDLLVSVSAHEMARDILRSNAVTERARAVRCPMCGAGNGESCELSTGDFRETLHRERGLTV